MYKFLISAKKELLMLISDKAGIAVMFVLPILLVFIITIVQDSAFRIVNENKISMYVVNKDNGIYGQLLTEQMKASGLFTMYEDSLVKNDNIQQQMLENDYLTGILIPQDFSENLLTKAKLLSGYMLNELGLSENELKDPTFTEVKFIHDPVLQENYCISVMNMLDAFLKAMEGEIFINNISSELGLTESPTQLKQAMKDHVIPLKRVAANGSDNEMLPNSTQHNVPAWTIFAMFFMVVSLGNNIVKERVNGSFVRLKTMPTGFSMVLGAKMFIYFMAASIQVIVVFSLAKGFFPLIDLPALTMPSNHLGFILIVFLSSLCAVSYALLIGAFAKTQQQSSGFGAVSIVIFAAIGGIWVPSFVMPEYLQTLSLISPLNWCLEGFYILFLKGGLWTELSSVIVGLLVFSASCLTLVYLRFKKEKFI